MTSVVTTLQRKLKT